MKIIYVIGLRGIYRASKRYRVYNLVQALTQNNIQAISKYEFDKDLISQDFLRQYDLIVFFKAHFSQHIAKIVENARRCRMPIIFDIDDLLFDENITPTVDSIVEWDEKKKAVHMVSANRYQRVIELCDFTTSSTQYLKNKLAQKFGKESFVIPNGLNKRQIEIANWIKEEKPLDLKKKKQIIIGYLSGTLTHRKDFSQIVPSLCRILNEYPNVYLKIVGHLDFNEFPLLTKYKFRIIRKGFVNWEQLILETKNVDINLAPLEIGNPFCEAKSELKYFEAALVEVPSVVSGTNTFCNCIEDKRNGLISVTTEDWYQNLKLLIEDQELYQTIIMNAQIHIRDTYYPDKIADTAMGIYETIIKSYSTVGSAVITE
jgi:glycosyltransferase involved in cell wall biosynthesis